MLLTRYLNLLLSLLKLTLLLTFLEKGDSVSREAILSYNSALQLHNNNLYEEAIKLYTVALDEFWAFPEAHQNVALLYDMIGHFEKAREHHQLSIDFAVDPYFKVSCMMNLYTIDTRIVLNQDKQQLLQWVELCNQALLISPNHTEALFNLGVLYNRLGAESEALKIFNKIVSIEPTNHKGYLNIGNYYFVRFGHVQATEYYLKALQFISPTDKYNTMVVHTNLAQSYRERGMYKASLRSFEITYISSSTGSAKLFNLLNIITIKGLSNQWQELELIEEHLMRMVIDTMHKTSTEEILLMGRNDMQQSPLDPYTFSLFRFLPANIDLWLSIYSCPYRRSLPLSSQQLNPVATERKKILRVGYLSFDWRDHPMGRLTAALVTPPAQPEREIHCFMFGYWDKSHVAKYVKNFCNHYHDIFLLKNDEDAAVLIQSHNIDILIDITGHTYNNRIGIALHKPAPIVVNYLGYAGSIGCSRYDFSMVDRMVAPPEYSPKNAFREKLVYLPFSYQANSMPVTMVKRHNKAITIGKSQKVIQICVPNANKKFEPISFWAWMNILKRNPMSTLVLLDFPDESKVNILLEAAYYGILSNRLTFLSRLPWKDHLNRAGEVCDIAFDSFVYGAHTTATDLLWMGIPIVMLRSFGISSGMRMPSRVASSITENVACSNCGKDRQNTFVQDILIQDSIKDYEDNSIRIQKSDGLLEKLTELISSVSCHSPAFDREISVTLSERAHIAMYEEYNLRQQTSSDTVTPNSAAQFHIILSKENLPPSNFCIFDIAYQQLFTSDGHVSPTVQQSESCLDLSRRLQAKNNYSTTAIQRRRAQSMDWHGDVLAYNNVHESSIQRLVNNYGSNLDDIKCLSKKRSVMHQFSASSQFSSPGDYDCKTTDPYSISTRLSILIKEVKDTEKVLLSDYRGESVVEEVIFCGILSGHLLDTYNGIDIALYQEHDPLRRIALFSSIFQQFLTSTHEKYIEKSRIFPTSIQSNCLDSSVSDVIEFPWWSLSLEELQDILRIQLFPCIAMKIFNYDYLSDGIRYDFSRIESLLLHKDEYLNRLGAENFHREKLSRWLTDFAIALLSVGRKRDAFHWMSQAFLLSPQSMFILNNIAVILMDTVNDPWSYAMAVAATLSIHSTQRRDHILNYGPLALNNPQPSHGMKTIAIYCFEYSNAWWPGWGPRTFFPSHFSNDATGGGQSHGSAAGGSEEAVAYIAIELARLGYQVTIFGDISIQERDFVYATDDHSSGRLRWLHWLDYDVERSNYDVFIAWRYSYSLALNIHSKSRNSHTKTFLWLHDLVSIPSLPPFETGGGLVFDGIFVQSSFHGNFILKEYQNDFSVRGSHRNIDKPSQAKSPDHVAKPLSQIFIIPNGLTEDALSLSLSNLSRFEYDKNDDINISLGNRNYIFVYGSSPSRGLEWVLQEWKFIKAALPNAILQVYYGFTDTVKDKLRKQMGDGAFEAWYQKIQQQLNQDGIRYIGAVSHDQLMRAYFNAGFLLYPTTFQETGCITVLRAMAAGAIPITSRLQESVLKNLADRFDLGPVLEPLTLSVANNMTLFQNWLREKWTPSVIAAALLSDARLGELRVEMKAFVRDTYTWKSSALAMADAMFG